MIETMKPRPTPTQVEKHSPTEMKLAWNTGETFAIPFVEIRFQCPCAVCVDEKTGVRVLKRESIAADIRPTAVTPVGRYALQIVWSDRHSTGMYGFDRLYEISKEHGKSI